MARPPKGAARHLFKNCETCGAEMKLYLAFASTRFCSNRCYGESKRGRPVHAPSTYKELGLAQSGQRNHNWKGGWSLEKQREKHRDWCRRNRDKVTARNQRRRSMKKNAPGSFTAEEWASIKASHGYKCAACKAPETLFEVLTVDHIVPLVAGGTNDPSNIQPLCLRCNSSKGARRYWRGRKRKEAA